MEAAPAFGESHHKMTPSVGHVRSLVEVEERVIRGITGSTSKPYGGACRRDEGLSRSPALQSPCGRTEPVAARTRRCQRAPRPHLWTRNRGLLVVSRHYVIVDLEEFGMHAAQIVPVSYS